jgi:hypothetical protein
MNRVAEKYIDDVISGAVEVSETTKLTFKRHKADLRVAPENGWYFDKKASERVFDFCSLVKHSPDKRSWITFVPEPWQAAIIYIVLVGRRRTAPGGSITLTSNYRRRTVRQLTLQSFQITFCILTGKRMLKFTMLLLLRSRLISALTKRSA